MDFDPGGVCVQTHLAITAAQVRQSRGSDLPGVCPASPTSVLSAPLAALLAAGCTYTSISANF